MAAAGRDVRRALHWVMKVGHLRRSTDFLSKVFGMRVLRHEEFEAGCEATCNGPYGGRWSKTMVGFGPEQSNFALELTANYGIESYDKRDDLRFIAIRSDIIGKRFAPFRRARQVLAALKLGYDVFDAEGKPISDRSFSDTDGKESEVSSGSSCRPSTEASHGSSGTEQSSTTGVTGEGRTLGEAVASAASRPMEGHGTPIEAISEKRLLSAETIVGPDGIVYKLADTSQRKPATAPTAGVTTDATTARGEPPIDPFTCVCLSVKDLGASMRYWKDLLGMTRVDPGRIPGAEGRRGGEAGSASGGIEAAGTAGAAAARQALAAAGLDSHSPVFRSGCLSFDDHAGPAASGSGVGSGGGWLGTPALQLVETGAQVEHGTGYGRIAFATRQGPAKIWKEVEAAGGGGGSVINEPITLSTPGKADVVVAILADPDGYEICFVNEDGFYDLCSLGPGDDYVDWEERAALGGDGHPPPSLEGRGAPLPPVAGEAMLLRPQDKGEAAKSTADASAPTLAEALHNPGRRVVMWAAAWCKYCKRAMPAFVEASKAVTSSSGQEAGGAEGDGDKKGEVSAAAGGGGAGGMGAWPGAVDFFVADADRMSSEKAASAVQQIPAFVFYEGGKEIARYAGSDPEEIAVRIAAFAHGRAPQGVVGEPLAGGSSGDGDRDLSSGDGDGDVGREGK